jgi:hypothetical protein
MLTSLKVGVGSMFGKIIALDQENGKEQVVGKRSPSVAATMIKPPRTPRYFPKHIELYNQERILQFTEETHLFNPNPYGQALSKITSTGAMTYSFILAIERGHATTYGSMLNAMRSTIRDTSNELRGGIVTSLISMLLTGRTFSGEITQVCFFIINIVAVCILHISPLPKLW